MIDLMSLEPQKISKNLKGKFIMIYGLPGCGKTTLGSQFPKHLIASFEQGTNGLNNVLVQPIKNWNDWKEVGRQLIKKKDLLQEKIENIIIDTVDSAWDLCTKYVCANEGIEKLGDIPYGAAYDTAKKEFQNLFRELTFAGYGLVFISHSAEKTFKDEKGQEFQQIVPALPQRPYEIINKMVDITGYIHEVELEDGTSKRFIYFRGNKHFFAKSRFRFIEPKVDFNYDSIVKALFDAIDKEVEFSGGTATDDVNPYTVRDFDDLMNEAKSVWGQVVQKGKAEEVAAILEREFGKPIKFSEIKPEQKDSLEKVLLEIKTLL